MVDEDNPMQPKVSVVVPVYNVEPYLARCLDSLIAQTLQEIEIVCVNDGSTDGSIRILNAYADHDPRVRVISQINRGLGGARNTGIRASSGEYILFVDSDDWIEPKSCELLYAAALCHKADMACGSIRKTYPTRKPKWVEYYDEENIYASAQARFDGMQCPPHFNVVQKLFRRELLLQANLWFEEGVPFEDVEYIAHALGTADWMVTVPGAVYHYVVRKGSICRSPDTDERQAQLYAVHKRFVEYVDRIGVVIKPEYRWVKKYVHHFLGVKWLYVWERDGVEEVRLFNRWVVRRKIL